MRFQNSHGFTALLGCLLVVSVLSEPAITAAEAQELDASAPDSSRSGGSSELQWWGGVVFGLANPTSDLGRLSQSGPLLLVRLGRRLSHPFGLQLSLAHASLERGGIPKTEKWRGARSGPAPNLWILTAGPSINLSPRGLDVVDLTWTGCVGLVRWESGPSDVTDAFTDTDPAACLFMDAIINLNRHVAVNTHFNGFLLAGSISDDDINPFIKEFVHGFGLGARIRF